MLFTPSVMMKSFAVKPLKISVTLSDDLPTLTSTFLATPFLPFTLVAINTNLLC